MYRELVVNVTDQETRVALLEDGTIVELFIERDDESNITGNIYKGKVQRVLPGMQAAFVDIGLSQAAFLYVDDVLGENEIIHTGSNEEDDEEFEAFYPCRVNNECRIEDLIYEGQELLVQVAKSPISTKGARITSYMSLPGRYLVLMPNVDHIGISRKIEDERERKRLKDIILKIRHEKYGFILRTAGEGVDEENLKKEMDFLIKIWDDIQKKSAKVSKPQLIHKDLTVTLRAVRDLLTDEADKLVIDSRDVYATVQNFIKNVMQDLHVSVELYDGEEPIFDEYNIEGDISRALKRKVWLKSGGYIVIELTEALVSIDVNTGRFVGKHNFEETILKTNLEAVKEIAYQTRLRNIGGIIIIDFIDMQKEFNREKVYNSLRKALEKDKSKTNVLPMSELGLIQMTRKRVRKSLSRMLCEPCFYCSGSGQNISKKSTCYKICREILKDARDMMGNQFSVEVHQDVAALLYGEESRMVASLEEKIGKNINIYPNKLFHIEEYVIKETL